MLAAVDLDDQSLLATDKIHDVRSDWILANEFRVIDLTRTQPVPEASLSIRRIAAQAA
jgi:hypothetical protein